MRYLSHIKNNPATYLLHGVFILLLLCVPLTFGTSGIEVSSAKACWGASGCIESAFTVIFLQVGLALATFTGFLLFIAGYILDYITQQFVSGFSGWATGTLGGSLADLWTLVRDICNLAFIFGFIYIGIVTIISPDSARMKRFLSSIIIGAVLINFSLYLVEVVIDFTNFVATTVYNTITGDGTTTIGEAVLKLSGLSTIFSEVKSGHLASISDDLPKGLSYLLSISLIFLTFALTFFVTAFMFILRFIELFLIMVCSPIIFAAGVFPQTTEYREKILKKLWSSAFFAPAYFLFLYIVFILLKAFSAQFLGSDPSLPQLFISGDTNKFGIIINICLIIILLVMSLTLGSKLSVSGGNFVSKTTTDLRKSAQGVVGRGALRGTGLNKVTKGIAEKQDEWRKSSSKLKNVGAFAMRATGVDTAAGAVRNAKFGSKESLADVDKKDKEIQKARATDKELQHGYAAIEAGKAAAENSDEAAKMQQAIANATNAQLVKMLERFEKDTEAYNKIAATMSASQFNKLQEMKDEEFSEEKKLKLTAARSEAKQKALNIDANGDLPKQDPSDTAHGFDAQKNFAKALIGDLEVLGMEILKKNAKYLTAAQMEDLKKSNKFVEAQYKALEAEREKGLKSLNQAELEQLAANRKADDVAKLPHEILMRLATPNAGGTSALNVDVIEKVIKQGTMDRSKQQELIDLLRSQSKSKPAMEKFLGSSYVVDRFGKHSNSTEGHEEHTPRGGRDL